MIQQETLRLAAKQQVRLAERRRTGPFRPKPQVVLQRVIRDPKLPAGLPLVVAAALEHQPCVPANFACSRRRSEIERVATDAER